MVEATLERKTKQEEEEFFTFNFKNPLGASISIEEIQGTQVKANHTEVKVKDFSASGLRFETDLKFPIREDVVYSFQAKILNKDVEVKGCLQRREQTNEDKYEYGLSFQFGEKKDLKQRRLVQLVSCLQISSRYGNRRGMKYLESLNF